MATFILRRLIAGIVLIFAVSSVVFLLLYAASGDIARRILGISATAADVAAKNEQLGLNRPLFTQYFEWLGHAVTGDLGESWFTGQSVTDGITSRLAVTLSLVIGAIVIIAVLSAVLGVWAAVRRGWVDKVVQGISILGFAIPNFLFALFLVTVFAINLGWFEPTGYVNFSDSVTGWLGTVTLPIIALALGGIAGVSAQVRGSVIDALRQDYVRTLRSRGLGPGRVVFKHVLRNAAAPALSVLGLQFLGLVGGAIIVENIFTIPGLGQIGVSAPIQGDIPMVMGLVVAIALLTFVVNLLVDLAQGWLNPKVRV